MTYCNEKNGELLSPEELKKRINTSFPDGMPEVCGWHLVDELSLYPVLSERQTAVQDKVVYQDGKWMMTYRVNETSSYEETEGIDFRKRCEVLEKAVADLAYIVSSLEIERMSKAEKEAE